MTINKSLNQQFSNYLKMKERILQVKQFHDTFLIGSSEQIQAELAAHEYELRHRLFEEENNEYLAACRANDIVEIADALGDMLYIIFGTALKHGLQHKLEAVFDEIHRSNMSKLDEKGKPVVRDDGKILKSALYTPPNIRSVLDTD